MGNETACTECGRLIRRSENEDHISSNSGPHNVFHEPCGNCDTLTDTPTDSLKLCHFCCHLRLKHLLYCDSAPSWTEISLGSFSDIQHSHDCDLHRLIYLATKAYVNAMKPDMMPISSLQPCFDGNRSHCEDYSASFDAFRVYVEDFEQVQVILGRVPVSGLVDWDRTRGWLSRCNLEHERCQPLQIGSLPNGFRVIDVLERRVVTPSVKCQFVALSYVWGKKPDATKLMATLATIQDIEQEGGLEASKLPLVIEDAIQVCVLLKQRYLWVDRLCIVQDDISKKQEQIDGMAAIYASAIFALIIGHGDSMNVQIPGVSLHRPTWTSHLRFDGLLIENRLPDFKQTIENTAWSTRGWTYQESVLPNRKLFLTGTQVMYECQHGLVHEDNALNEDAEYEVDLPLKFYGLPSSLFSRGEYDPGFDYTRHISSYNARSLTYMTDIYNAIAAITSVLYGPTDSLIHGLPLKDFDCALLWHPSGEVEYEARHPINIWLPSWSWSSVSGPLRHLSFFGALLQWALITEDPPNRYTRLVGTDRNNPSMWAEYQLLETSKDQKRYLSKTPQIYMDLASSEGCFETEANSDSGVLYSKSFQELGAELMGKWPSYTDFCTDVLSTKTLLGNIPMSLPKESFTTSNECIIATYAQVTYLSLSIHQSGKQRHCPRTGLWYDILDNDQKIGLISPSLDLDLLNTGQDLQNRTFKFIALSVSGCSSDVECLFHDRRYPPPEKGLGAGDKYIEDVELDITYRDCNSTPLSPAPSINVMIIGERDGLSCRLAVGWILLKKWAQLERYFETVFLI